MTGELLALLGPLHPSAIAFHPHALSRPVLGAQPAEQQQPPATAPASNKRNQTAEHRAEPWSGAALRQLHGFLTVPDVTVIRLAQNVLRCVICLTSPTVTDTWSTLAALTLITMLLAGV